MDSILSLKGYGVGIGERTILGGIDLDIPDKGVTSLFGPSGSGKSTLLRTLCGLNDASPNLRTWGEALYVNERLGSAERPVMMVQTARLQAANVLQNVLHGVPERHTLQLSQQRELVLRLLDEWDLGELKPRLNDSVLKLDLATSRCLAIMRISASNPKMICLDEPTTSLSPEGADKVLKAIRFQAEKRAVLIVLHNRSHSEYLGGKVVLLAGGYVQEEGSSATFFKDPKTESGATFARTGSCSVPSPDALPEDLAPDTPRPKLLPKEASDYVRDSFGPRGFLWIKKGSLAGTPMPGVFYDEEYDVRALNRVEITHLITLTEPPPKELAVSEGMLRKYSIENSQFPIPDMGAPTLQQAVEICRSIDRLIAAGHKVAVHCKAGMGRTGTVLCAYLIWEGDDAVSALHRARDIEPRWVQSEVQVEFLEAFEQATQKMAIEVAQR